VLCTALIKHIEYNPTSDFLLFCKGMKKWITSNYHYMVPEYDGNIEPNFDAFLAHVQRGIQVLGADKAAPVVIGPVTMVHLCKIKAFATGFLNEEKHTLLEKLMPVYKDLLQKVASLGVGEIQIHEAALVMRDEALLPLFKKAYPLILPENAHEVDINMVSFMEDIGDEHYKWLISIEKISIISLDFTRGDNLGLVQKYGFPSTKLLGAGLVDSRSVWCTDPGKVLPIMEQIKKHVENVRVSPSGSLQYVPWSLESETDLQNHKAGPVLSFAKEKLAELSLVAAAFENTGALSDHLKKWFEYVQFVSENSSVQYRLEKVTEADFCRAEPFEIRRGKQLPGCPVLPTTTIGSFPQTKAIRQLRSKLRNGTITGDEYKGEIDKHIAYMIGIQEALGLDILVHGEPERTDMVEFFGQQLEGMLFSKNGWVQSFGSRCVRPPIIWADVFRPRPMTTREFGVAQAFTEKPVKGMLTGPVTILNWSFPRADIPRKVQAMQLALCLRDEVADLEACGCKVIQVDEPALREAMPLCAAEKKEYLDWAVDAFRLATAVAKSETQIHTHMCYCEFDDCMDAIDKLDTDVNSIENARSDNATLFAFKRIGYTKDLGPGTYDIHSPVVPPVEFIVDKLSAFLECVDREKLIVNPDCGLKTRAWPETIDGLKNMVEATHLVRARFGCSGRDS
jgi:5-methyltetrahydropteroyltriglutamate--homocysteine methyltransferase